MRDLRVLLPMSMVIISIVIGGSFLFAWFIRAGFEQNSTPNTVLEFTTESGITPDIYLPVDSYIGPHVKIYKDGKLIIDTGEGYIGTPPND